VGAGFKAIEVPGKPDIHDHQVRRLLAGLANRLFAGADFSCEDIT